MIQVNPSSSSDVPRTQWAAALMRVPAEEVLELAEALGQRYRARFVKVPQAGLALMAFRDSVMGAPFYLGELPMSVAHVALTDEEGREHQGGAQVMADDPALTSAIAVCDAVLAAGIEGSDRVLELLEAGRVLMEQEAALRRAMLERTRVSFSLMSHDEESGGAA